MTSERKGLHFATISRLFRDANAQSPFANSESSDAYFYLCEALFKTIQEVAVINVQWWHINGTGINTVVVDMCQEHLESCS